MRHFNIRRWGNRVVYGFYIHTVSLVLPRSKYTGLFGDSDIENVIL